jgi:hypothetical protein
MNQRLTPDVKEMQSYQVKIDYSKLLLSSDFVLERVTEQA